MDKLMPPLVPELRRKVSDWRTSGCIGATDTSRSLLRWWFETSHLMDQHNGPATTFEYFFAQREALETIIWLVDVRGYQDKLDLMRFDSSGAVSAEMFDESWRRLVVKMAMGSGKTKVLSLALAWSFFHKTYEDESSLARNFLVIAPNIIVLDRIYRDFQGLRIFFADPVIPDNGFDGRNWRDDFQLTLHKQDDVRGTRKTGNIFLTNIHRVYSGDVVPPSADDDDTMDYFLGRRPTGATTDSQVDLGTIVREIEDLLVMNDEAHHIHDSSLAWFQSIQDVHIRLLQKDQTLSMVRRLRDVRPFVVKNQGCVVSKKSVFNKTIGDSGLELEFASFLEDCPDVVSYGKNYLAVQIKLDYVNAAGDMAQYIPDFFVKLNDGTVVVVEAKGREELDLPEKMARLRSWCDDINAIANSQRFGFAYVDESGFERYRPKSFAELQRTFTAYQA